MPYLLGVDLGTSGLKAAVFDPSGRALGTGYRANQDLPMPAGWAEQDPRMWWRGCSQAIREALSRSGVDGSAVAGIGVCGFHHCPVFLDASGEPTRPTIVTHDVRLGQSLEELRRSGILEQVIRITGSLVLTGHFPPIYQHVLAHDGEALKKTRWIILAKDYLRYQLTGRIGTEICDATGTNLVAMPEQEWSEPLCELMQVPREKLPDIGNPSEIFGEVTPEAAAAAGLAAGTPVVYGGGDSHCALVGLGAAGPGEVGLLLGTNSTLRACFRGFIRDREPRVWVQQHVVPEMFTASASSMAGSSIMEWFRKMFCAESRSEETGGAYQELESLAASAPPGSDGLLFHPYLRGERSPFCNPDARGSFLGIAHWHTKGEFVRAVMEGVAFCIANCFELIKESALRRSQPVSAIRMGEAGGGRLGVWRQIIADALDFPVEVVHVEEPGCLGAALLAKVGIGECQDIRAAVGQAVRVGARTSPDPSNSSLYGALRSNFNDAYSALEPILYRPHPTSVVEVES